MLPSNSRTNTKVNACIYITDLGVPNMAAAGDRNGQSVSEIWPALMIGALVFLTKPSGRLGRYPLGAMGMIVYLIFSTVNDGGFHHGPPNKHSSPSLIYNLQFQPVQFIFNQLYSQSSHPCLAL